MSGFNNFDNNDTDNNFNTDFDNDFGTIEGDLDGGFDFGDLDDLEVQEVEQVEFTYKCFNATYTSSTGALVNIILTDNADTAKDFNEEIDEFSDSEYFVIPDGIEVHNNPLLQKLTISDEVQLTKAQIEEQSKPDFNSLYVKAMLGIVS